MALSNLKLANDKANATLIARKIIALDNVASNEVNVLNMKTKNATFDKLNISSFDAFTSIIGAIDTIQPNQLLATGSTTNEFITKVYSQDMMANTIAQYLSNGNTNASAFSFSSIIPRLIHVSAYSFVLGGSGGAATTTVSASVPAASSLNTIPDAGTDAFFLMIAGSQTSSGIKTFTQSSLTIESVTNQLVFNSPNSITLNAPTPTASRVFTLIDAGVSNAEIVLVAGTQTLLGSKTLTNAIPITSIDNQLVINNITLTAPQPAGSRIYTIPDVGTTNANFVLSEGIQTLNGSMTFPLAMTITDSSNQLILNTDNTITINAVPHAASRVYSIQNPGLNVDFVMTQGTQSIGNIRTFTDSATFASTMTLASGAIFSCNPPAANRSVAFPDPLASPCFWCMSTRFAVAQTISITTTVVVDGPSFVITTQGPTATAGGSNTFTVTNSFVLSTSVIFCKLGAYNNATYGTNGIPYPRITSISAGTFDISIFNIHTTNALAGTGLILHVYVC